MAKILLIDNDESVASSLKNVLEKEGYTVAMAITAEQGLACAQQEDFDAVLTDLQMPGPADMEKRQGLEIIKQLHAAKPQLPVILMTGHHTTESAIEATKCGAYDYILKPIDLTDLLEMISEAVTSSRLMSEPVEMGEAAGPTHDAIIGKSRVMQMVYKEIGRTADRPVTVLIRGETGTGKELVARAICQHSQRAHQPFVVVNCAAIPENLLESELFGHEPGAFTDAKVRRIGRFEQANGGTLFLDEIGDTALSTQVKLLRVLQEKTIQRLGSKETIPVDVRVITATHRNLELAIQDKEFREDLFYRLNVAVIILPPLRDRKEDIPELINYFLRRHGVELGVSKPSIAPEAVEFLKQQNWLGNVRELENVVRKALLASHGYTIGLESTRSIMATRFPALKSEQTISGYVAELLDRALKGELEDVHSVFTGTVERELYAQAIQLAGGDQSKAAKWLGVSRPTMREKLTRYSLLPARSE